MSSRDRKGYSVSRVSNVSPLASICTIWCTGMRVPFTHACPWQMLGSIEMRSNGTSVAPLPSLLIELEHRCCLLHSHVSRFDLCSDVILAPHLYLGVTYNIQLQIAADPTDANTAYAYDLYYDVAPERFGPDGRVVLQYLPGYVMDSFVTASGGPLYVDLYESGVYKSTDRGNTWSAVNTGLPVTWVLSGLAVAPSNPSVLYRSNLSSPVSITTDGGASWSPTGTPPASLGALAVSATNPSIVYAVAMAGPQPLYISQDAGQTWNPAAGLGAAKLSQILPDPRVAPGPTLWRL